jgi:arginyl-tRNA--protein-N-Asp/Glu arginylyltransferase
LKEKPKHIYTIEFHRAIINDEMFEVYRKYEKAVHGKDRDKD